MDVIIIGGGPVGLACAIEARREGLRALVVEKGSLVNSIVGYPAQMEFFSTPELIEIGGYPFSIQDYKPSREEAIEYYRGVSQREALDIRLYERVLDVRGSRGGFTVVTDKAEYPAGSVVVEPAFEVRSERNDQHLRSIDAIEIARRGRGPVRGIDRSCA